MPGRYLQEAFEKTGLNRYELARVIGLRVMQFHDNNSSSVNRIPGESLYDLALREAIEGKIPLEIAAECEDP